MFQKRHYDVVANVLKANKAPIEHVMRFVEAFSADNPRFNKGKFIESCGTSNPQQQTAKAPHNA